MGEMTISKAEAVPLTAPNGGVSSNAAATNGEAGGCLPFTNRCSAWDAVVDQADSVTDLRDFLIHIEEQPNLKAAANLRALDRLRDELNRLPEDCNLTDPVVLNVQDAALIARSLLQRLR